MRSRVTGFSSFQERENGDAVARPADARPQAMFALKNNMTGSSFARGLAIAGVKRGLISRRTPLKQWLRLFLLHGVHGNQPDALGFDHDESINF